MKREDVGVKRKDVKRKKAPAAFVSVARTTFYVFTFYVFMVHASSVSLAQPTQEDVFKSIGDSVNEPVDSSRALAVAAGIGGAVVLLVVVGHWRQRDRKPELLNHPGKLLKEVLRNVPLKGAEVKQVKALCQTFQPLGGGRVESPLTLLLCPSLLADAAKQSRGKADLAVVGGLVKRLVGKR